MFRFIHKIKNYRVYLFVTFLLFGILFVSSLIAFAAGSGSRMKQSGESESVVLKKIPAFKAASIRAVVPSSDAQTKLWNELNIYLKNQGIAASAPGFTMFHGQKGQNLDLEVVQPVANLGKDSRRVKFKLFESVEMVSILHMGPYQTMPTAYKAIDIWNWKNCYEVRGPFQECYLKGEWNEKDPQGYLTEIRVPVKKSETVTISSIKGRITRMAATEMKRNQVTGMSLALVDADGIIFTVNLGYADLGKKIPVTFDTLFKIGSISKLFTATAIMQLAEQGKIDIDQPLQKYIPEFSIKTRFPNAGPITIRSLMTHRSGIPGNYLPEVKNPEYPYFTSIVNDLKQEYTAYPPNHITAYSNSGSPLLGVIVERVSGQKFNDYVTNHILKPLAMDHSSFDLRQDMVPLLSKGYRQNKTAVDDICPNGIHPEGSLRSSVGEMSHFIQMVLKNGAYNEKVILKETTLNKMLTPQPHLPLDLGGYGLDTTGSIGLNWFLYDDPYSGRILMHPGGTRLFFSQLTILKDSGLGVVVLTNSVNGETLASKIAAETLRAALKAKTGPRNYYGETETTSREIKLGRIEGHFATGMGWVEFEQDSKRFQAKVQKYPYLKFHLTKNPDGWYTGKPYLWGLFPVKIPDLEKLNFGSAEISGEQVLLGNNNGVLSILGEKIELTPIPSVWRRRCGHYIETDYHGLTNLGHRMVLDWDHGMITGYIINKNGAKSGPLVLTPVSETGLLIRGLGRNMHEIIRVVKTGGEERLSYEGLLFKKK